MKILTLNTSDGQPEIDKILFSRPVGPLQSKRIGVVWFGLVHYLHLHTYVQSILTLRHHPVIFTENPLLEAASTDTVVLSKNSKSSMYENTDSAIEQLESNTINIFTSSEAIGSKAQIFIEKYLAHQSMPTSFFGSTSIQSLYSSTAQPHRIQNSFLFGQPKDFDVLAKHVGIAPKLDQSEPITVRLSTMLEMATATKNSIVTFYANQILFVSHTTADKAVVINFTDRLPMQSSIVYIATLASLIADTSTNSTIDLAYTAGYLTRKAIESKDIFTNLRSATEAF